ncbi:hypothetical protein HMPREF3188_01195 [Tissierellia bacterium KA00581]|jgi:hypothetical protein|nr:hypothetical protein HMPREF3188_01195 [Tissierellia bacterium KA00581]
MKIKKLILISVFVCVALIVSLLESYVPIPIPNVRLGLSNVIVINAILLFRFRDTFFVVFLKSLLLVIILGNPVSFLYNFFAGFISLSVMYFFYRYFSKIFSIIGISVLGSIFHVLVQILISALLLDTFSVFNFLSILEILAVFTGIIVGIISNYLYKILRSNYVK